MNSGEAAGLFPFDGAGRLAGEVTGQASGACQAVHDAGIGTRINFAGECINVRTQNNTVTAEANVGKPKKTPPHFGGALHR